MLETCDTCRAASVVDTICTLCGQRYEVLIFEAVELDADMIDCDHG